VPAPTAGVASGGSLRRRVSRSFAVAATLLVIGAALAGGGLSTAAHDRTRLLNQVDPAVQHADDYETALVNQSAGARLYAETGSASALVAYRQGVASAAVARGGLVDDLGTIPQLRPDLDRIDTMTAAWQAGFLRPLVATPGPDPAAVSLARTTSSSLVFSRIRQQFALLQSALQHERTGAVRGFNDALNLLTGLVIAVFVGLAAILLAVWIGLRRSVLTPLAAVGADSRLVTAGAFDHPVAAHGPIEIAGLAHDIDAMRSRVVDDLHALEVAHRELAAQRVALEETSVELARSNRDLEQFAYVASHDLQEPLRKVAAFCQLLSERYHDQLDEKGQQYIEFAVDGAKRMQSLVTDLLSFSRVGRTRDRWSEVPLGAVVDVALSNLEARIERSGATVNIHGELPTVRGDATLLAALFQNLIGNAIKFQGEDPPVVDLSATTTGEQWAVRVTDNGIGIEEKYSERVFVIFQRLHTRESYEGTGIGLALSRKIVEFHGGEISIEVHPPPGTTMLVTFPLLAPSLVSGSDADPAMAEGADRPHG
jgi:signal transduction histidine kinase